MKEENIYVFDFETTTSENPEVWLWGVAEYDRDMFCWDRDIGSFFEFLGTLRKEVYQYFYAYNAKFDFSFILCNAAKFGWKVTKSFCAGLMRNFRYARLKKGKRLIEIRDASPLFSSGAMPLAKVLESWTDGHEKGETPLLEEKPEEIKEAWLNYLKTDVLGLKEALRRRWELMKTKKLTTSADVKALILSENSNFKTYWPNLSLEEDVALRPAYRGGFVWANPTHQNKIKENVTVYDVNSMYPSVMLEDLPVGKPILSKETMLTPKAGYCFLQKIYIRAYLKEGKVPVLPIKLGSSYVFHDDVEGEFLLTDRELALVEASYSGKIEYGGGYYFLKAAGLRDHVLKYTEMKETSEGAMRELAKLILNAPSGKWGQRPDGDTYELTLDEENCPKYKKLDSELLQPFHLPTSIFITSYARVKIIKSILEVGKDNVTYTDTDSLHTLNEKSPRNIHAKKLGAWKKEKIFAREKVIRTKRYAGELKKGELCIGLENEEEQEEIAYTVAGISPNWITKAGISLEEFREGLEIPLQVMRFCAGGMRMIDSHRTI